MFTALFSDPDLLRELYCALGGVDLPPDVPVSINTLENVMYMELEVKVININEGKNEEIVKQCKILSDYSIFISKIYSLIKTLGNKEEAVTQAVKYCHKHDILKEFLEIHGSEAHNSAPR